VRSRRFDLAAVAYARLRRPKLALTRVREIALGCLRGRLPTLIEVHGRPSHAGLPEFRSLLRTPGLVGVVTVSDPLRELCMELGADQRLVAVFPNGVDVERFRADMLPKAARRLIGVPDGRPIVVYAGHLYEHKGIAALFEAAANLSDVLFLVVGGWPDDVDRWRMSTRSLSNVLFTGFVPNEQIPRYLAAADLCVLPNSGGDEEARWTSPLKLFEYMAAGRPIVASDLPVLRALLADGRNALLVRPDDPSALADGIRTVLDSPDLAARLARGARDDACRHSWGGRARGILGHFAPHLLHTENQSPAHS
jgi:glycosyltransferase involved in cell wall biosynthesis